MNYKHTKFSLRLWITLTAFVLSLAGCGGSSDAPGTGTSTGTSTSTTTTTPTLFSITVSPGLPPNLSVGLTQQFTASATYVDYTTGAISYVDVSNTAAWASSNAAAASINGAGLANGLTVGATNITATLSGVTSNTAKLNVIPAQLLSMTISPSSATIAAGQTQQFTVTGSYSDGSTQNLNSAAWWSSSNTAATTVNAGLAFGAAPNTTPVTISASYSTSVNATLTVSNYSIGGTVVDLPVGSSVTIQNGADVLTISGNGTTPVPFIFPSGVAAGGTYNVTVTTQPGGTAHACTVVDGGGTIATNFISFVQVVCAPAVGTVAGGLRISMNSSNNGTAIHPYTTAQGTPAGGFVDGTGTDARFNSPAGAAYDSNGNLYVADSGNNAIRKITPAGVVSTLAGSGTAGLVNTSASVTAGQAQFNWPRGIAVDSADNVYVADAGNNVIRKITQAGVVTTFAGTGTAGSTNSTNPLTATFKNPHGIVVDALNNVYVADTSNNLIRKIASTGPVTTFAGSLTTTFLNDGVGAAASFNLPNGIIMDKTGTTLYVTDTYNHAIRGIVISSALVYTVAGSGPFSGGTLDGPTTAATLSFPANVAVDASNNIYVADNQGMLIRKIVGSYSGGAYSGTVTKLAGASVNGFGDGPALASAFYGLAGVAVDSSNNVFVTDSGNNLIRKYTP